MRAILVFLAALAAPGSAWADFTGLVIDVHDGNTLTVLVNQTQLRVQLQNIDAPEIGQAFGNASKRSLYVICMEKEARVTERRKDRYGHTIGRVRCATVDASNEQVRKGMAWVLAPKGSPLYGLQVTARLERRGLWADTKPVAPWDWRQNKPR
jgi:endonuclease YncB( thermonuclease family)